MNHEHKVTIHDMRHGEKPKDIRPDTVTKADIQRYRTEHTLGPDGDDNDIAQLIISKRGGPVYADKPGQTLDAKDKTELTYMGIRDAQALGTEIFQEAERSPRGKIYFFLASPAGRTLETQAVIEDRIEYLIKAEKVQDLQTMTIENLETLPVDGVIAKTDVTSFVFMKDGTEEIGPWNHKMLDEISKAFGGETVSELLWFARPEELPALKERLKREFPAVSPKFINGLQPKNYLTTPEERIGKIVAYFIQLLEIAQNNFPGRSVEMYTTSHNIILDATTIRLFDFDVSVEGARQKGTKARKPLEAGKIMLQNGQITITFRGLQKTLSLEDLKKIQDDLPEESLERKRQWNLAP